MSYVDFNAIYREMLQVEPGETAQAIFDMLSVGCLIWNRSYELLSCNAAMLHFFGFSSKSSRAKFINNFYNYLPEYQPCGTLSSVKLRQELQNIKRTGTKRVELMFNSSYTGDAYLDISLTVVGQGEQSVIVGIARDITELKLEINEIKESNDRVNRLLDSAPYAMSVWDKDYNIIDCNMEYIRLLGLKKRSDYFRQEYNKFTPEFQPCGKSSEKLRKEYFERVLIEGSITYEWTFVTKKGELIPTEVTIVKDERDDDYLIFAYVRDMRRIQKAHKILSTMREEVLRTRALFDCTPMSITFLDVNFNVIDCNQTAVEMFGVKNKTEYMDNFFRFIPKYQPCGRASKDLLDELQKKARKNGRIKAEFTRMKISGETFPVELTLVRIMHMGKYMFAWYSRDISDLKLLAAREKTLEHARLLIDNAPIGIDLWDENMNILDCNKAMLDRLGLDSIESYKKHFYELMPELQPDGRCSEDPVAELVKKISTDGFADEKFVQRSLDGRLIPIYLKSVQIKHNGETLMASYSLDVSKQQEIDRREREDEIRGRMMLDAAPIAVSFIDQENNIFDCNQALLTLLGLKDKQEYMEKFLNSSPKYQPCGELSTVKGIATVQKAIKEGTIRLEWTNMNVDGELIPTEKFVVPIDIGSKKFVAVYTRDLRDIKNWMELEREANERVQLMYDTAPLAITFWGESMQVTDCNWEAVRMFGVDSKEHYFEVLHKLSPEFQPCGKPSMELLAEYIAEATVNGIVRYEWTGKKLDGTLIPCEAILVRAGYKGSRVLIGYLRDISKIIALAKRERDANERNRILLDTTPLVASFWNKDNQIIDCNAQAPIFFGLSSKEEYIQRFHELSPVLQPDGSESAVKAVEYNREAFETGYVKFEWEHQKLDGTVLPCEIILVRINNHDGEVQLASYCRDLREMKQSLERELESSERVRLMFEATPIAAHLWDDSYKIVECNHETLNLFKIPNKDEYKDIFHNLSPKVQPCGTLSKILSEFYVKKAFKEGYSQFEWMHQSLYGVPIPTEVTLVRIKHRNSYIVAGFIRDLREIRNAMEREIEASDRAQTLINHVPIGIEMWDEDMMLIDCNIEAVRMVGAESKEDYLLNYYKFSPPTQPCGTPSRKISIDSTLRALIDGEYRLEWTFRHISGELVPCEVIVIRAKYRNKTYVIHYCRDLRESKKMLAKIREADERSSLMLDATPLACYLINKDFQAIDCNMEVLNLFELSNKQEAIDSYERLFPERQDDGSMSLVRMKELFATALVEGYNHFEFMQQKLDGELVPCNITLVRLNYRDDYVVASYIQDLREVKRMIQEMKRIEIAEENSQAKTRFLARMSHEIRTPMNAILGIADIQLQREDISVEMEEVFSKVHNSASSLLRIINDILDLSKIEAGKMELILDGYDTASLINDTVQLNLMRLGSKPLEFKLAVDQQLPSILYGDELRIKQILNNLLSNAIKYTNQGKVELSFYAVPGPMERMVYLGITVSDTGQGMTREQMDIMYSEYSRFNEQANRSIEGTGLGMTIVSNLVRMMDAQIYVDSEVNLGTMFTVLIPQETVSDSVIGPEVAHNLQVFEATQHGNERRTKIAREPMPYGRVLVVDDTETNLYVAKGLMSPYGLNVETVASGAEAIAKVEAGEIYDIIFMDHMMPIMDGIEATNIIRGMGYNNPIVALTANAVIGQADIFFRNGFSGFVSKPIDIHHLDAALKRFIRDKQPPEVIEAAHREKSRIMLPDDDLPKKLVESFLRDAKKSLEVLDEIYGKIDDLAENEHDMRMFTVNTHSMKSALANIRKKELSSMAGRLEQAGRNKDLKIISETTPHFLQILRQLINELTSDISDAESDEDPDLLKTCMCAIRDACEAFDKRGARKALNDLSSKVWSKTTKELIDRITQCILHSEFEEAADIAANASEQQSDSE